MLGTNQKGTTKASTKVVTRVAPMNVLGGSLKPGGPRVGPTLPPSAPSPYGLGRLPSAKEESKDQGARESQPFRRSPMPIRARTLRRRPNRDPDRAQANRWDRFRSTASAPNRVRTLLRPLRGIRRSADDFWVRIRKSNGVVC
jgi:hypothetical protein